MVRNILAVDGATTGVVGSMEVMVEVGPRPAVKVMVGGSSLVAKVEPLLLNGSSSNHFHGAGIIWPGLFLLVHSQMKDGLGPILLNTSISYNTEDEVTEKDIVPYVGMEFETEDHAYKFYNMYAGFIGFSIRKDWKNTSKLDKDIVIARRFVCFKEGLKRKKDQEGIKPRKDIRTRCLAQMTIGRESNGKYVDKSFANEHNHDLATPKSRHKLPSQRRISTVQAAEVELASRSDYTYFGDVVCFDTTYRTNKDLRPFAPFIGFNHHRESLLFSAALLYDETFESFEWLFKIFLKAMCGKKDVGNVFPESYHRLCLWHLFQNALKKVNHAFQNSDSFAAELRSCIYDFEYEEDFIKSWQSLLEKNNLLQNKWMGDLFKLKEKWALVYGRDTFSAGAMTIQLSESFNGRFRLYMKSTFNVLKIFRNFESDVLRVLNHLNIIIIPPKYILKWWTKHARSGCVLDNKGQIIKEDPKVVVLNRYKDNCRSAVEVSSRAAESEEASTFFKQKILNKRSLATSTGHSDINCQTDQVRKNDTIEKDDATQAKGMKKKGGASRVKGRPKSCVEKKKRNKDNNKFGSMRHDFISIPTPTTQNMPFLQGCQVPIIVDPNLTHANNHSQD
ncbi:hypothetical protein Lal_00038171 [Lupinus albus]|nr:hypothetical protein Lal_00038171 [Lupinus albus]